MIGENQNVNGEATDRKAGTKGEGRISIQVYVRLSVEHKYIHREHCTLSHTQAFLVTMSINDMQCIVG